MLSNSTLVGNTAIGARVPAALPARWHRRRDRSRTSRPRPLPTPHSWVTSPTVVPAARERWRRRHRRRDRRGLLHFIYPLFSPDASSLALSGGLLIGNVGGAGGSGANGGNGPPVAESSSAVDGSATLDQTVVSLNLALGGLRRRRRQRRRRHRRRPLHHDRRRGHPQENDGRAQLRLHQQRQHLWHRELMTLNRRDGRRSVEPTGRSREVGLSHLIGFTVERIRTVGLDTARLGENSCRKRGCPTRQRRT